MGRPSKDEVGYEEANVRWRKTMEERYGGKEGVHKMMQRFGRRGGRVKGKKSGFAANPARAMLAGGKGGRRSRRGLTFVREISPREWEYIIPETGDKIILAPDDVFRINDYLVASARCEEYKPKKRGAEKKASEEE